MVVLTSKPLSILIVESNRSRGDMIFHETWLRRNRHQVRDFLTNTDAFLAVLHDLRYDVAVLSRDKWYDIMPCEHIITLSKHIHPQVPIISTSREYRVKAYGSDAFLRVPYTFTNLMACMKNQLEVIHT